MNENEVEKTTETGLTKSNIVPNETAVDGNKAEALDPEHKTPCPTT